jgi:cation diffusion facilitator family transporter
MEENRKGIKKATILGLLGNIFLLIIKGLVGFATNSQAMIADFFNSAGDILSSIFAYFGNKISSRPQDEDHDLGHGKAEYVFSFLISIVMFYVSVRVIINSVQLLKQPGYMSYSIFLIIVCLITIVVKFLLFIYTSLLSSKLNNILIKAASLDHRNDCFLTGLSLLSIVCSYYGIFYIDGIAGIIISLWIIYQAYGIFIESYDVLTDKSISKDAKEKVLKIVERHPEIKKTQHFNSTPVGYKYQISLTIFVDGNLSTFESHKIADDLEKEIDREIEEVFLTVIHVNPL